MNILFQSILRFFLKIIFHETPILIDMTASRKTKLISDFKVKEVRLYPPIYSTEEKKRILRYMDRCYVVHDASQKKMMASTIYDQLKRKWTYHHVVFPTEIQVLYDTELSHILGTTMHDEKTIFSIDSNDHLNV
jgi:hypothetical protein